MTAIFRMLLSYRKLTKGLRRTIKIRFKVRVTLNWIYWFRFTITIVIQRNRRSIPNHIKMMRNETTACKKVVLFLNYINCLQMIYQLKYNCNLNFLTYIRRINKWMKKSNCYFVDFRLSWVKFNILCTLEFHKIRQNQQIFHYLE